MLEGEGKKMHEMAARENHLGRGKRQRAGKETGDRNLKKSRRKVVLSC